MKGPLLTSVDVGNRDHIYYNVNLDVSYEDTLEDIEKTRGSVPVFMRYLPRKVLIHNWSSWKNVDEINMERASKRKMAFMQTETDIARPSKNS